MKSAAAAADEQRAWWRPARTVTFGGLGTALHRGELFALRGGAARLLEGLVQVREAFVRGELTTPRSRTSRRTIEIGPRTLALLREHWRESVYQGDRNLVFFHPSGAERPSTRAGARVPTSAPRSPNRCFQLMETDEPALFDEWARQWSDLIEFEIVPVLTSAQAAAHDPDA